MRVLIILFSLTLFMISCSSVKNEDQKGITNVTGKISKQIWLDSTETIDIYQTYQPDEEKIDNLNKLISGREYKYVIFAGADCVDCHENLPKLFKIFDRANIIEDRYSIYVLNNKLEEPSGFYRNFDIPTTPSVFVLKKDKQIGLITYPYYDWLNQIIKIIEEDLDEE